MKIKKIINDLYPYHYSVVSSGNDTAIKIFKKYLKFKITNFNSNLSINGWVIPRPYIIQEAKIFDLKNKNCLYDGKKNPLGVILNTSNFSGTITQKKLKDHIFYHKRSKKFIPFHCTLQYRPSSKNWGFCMSKKNFLELKDEKYFVNIKKKYIKTTLKTLHYVIPGKSNKVIILYAHNCHPFQANDNMSGCSVGIDVFKKLKKKNNYFTYILLISPEIYGPLFWLKKNKKKYEFVGAIKVGALGNDNMIKMQKSFTGKSFLDKIFAEEISKKFNKYKIGKFKQIWGNDEIVFEAPGYEIPSITITRYPFKEYHSDQDTPDKLKEIRLKEASNFILSSLKNLERRKNLYLEQKQNKTKTTYINNNNNLKFKFTGKGLYCLSNKKYDLYEYVWDPSSKDNLNGKKDNRVFHNLMTNLPRLSQNGITLKELSKIFKIKIGFLKTYLKKWEKKDLGKIYY